MDIILGGACIILAVMEAAKADEITVSDRACATSAAPLRRRGPRWPNARARAVNFAAFFSYVILSTITPGPNNIMSMSNAVRYGFMPSAPFNFSVLAGNLCVMSACALFSSLLYELIPTIEPFMLCAGAAYILWLAAAVLRSKPREAQTGDFANSFAAGRRPVRQRQGDTYGITAMSSFILPHYRDPVDVAGFVLFLSFMGFAGTLCWACFGAVFELFFSKYRNPST